MEAFDGFASGKNAYQILELEKGPECSDNDIKAAYRRLVLTKHPDKRREDKNAAAEFHELQQAYALLKNKEARAALDDLLRAQALREERYANQSSKRQKLREELDRREQQHEKQRSQEDKAKAQLKAELAALRARAQAEAASRQQEAAAAADAARRSSGAAAPSSAGTSRGSTPPAGGIVDEATQLLMQTVKVSWDPRIGNYTTDRIRQLFSAQPGITVEDAVHKEPKHKKKGKASALVVLGSIQQVAAATQLVLGDSSNPLLILPYYKVVPGAAATEPGGAGAAAAFGSGSAVPQGTSSSFGAAAAAAGRPVPSKPLFPVSASAGVRPAPKPAAPLFPVFPAASLGQQGVGASGQANGGATTAPPSAAAAAAVGSSSFSSFPGASSFSSFPAAAQPGPSSFPGFPAATQGLPGAGSTTTRPATAGATGDGVGVGVVGLEGSVLAKMQQRAAERAWLVEQLRAQEAEEQSE